MWLHLPRIYHMLTSSSWPRLLMFKLMSERMCRISWRWHFHHVWRRLCCISSLNFVRSADLTFDLLTSQCYATRVETYTKFELLTTSRSWAVNPGLWTYGQRHRGLVTLIFDLLTLKWHDKLPLLIKDPSKLNCTIRSLAADGRTNIQRD